jgi:hypothetical protein
MALTLHTQGEGMSRASVQQLVSGLAYGAQ